MEAEKETLQLCVASWGLNTGPPPTVVQILSCAALECYFLLLTDFLKIVICQEVRIIERQTDLPTCDSFLLWLQQSDLSQAGRFIWISNVGVKDPSNWAISCCFSKPLAESWIGNGTAAAHVESQHHRQWLYLLYPNTGPYNMFQSMFYYRHTPTATRSSKAHPI